MIRGNKCAQKRVVTGKIVSKTQITAGHFQMGLLCPYIAQNANPGQFIQLRVTGLYDPLLCRPLAVYRSNGDVFDILFKVVGKGTRILAEKAVGDAMDIIGPLGNGFPVDDDLRRAILVAGGMGVAALMKLAEEIAERRITALIGASTRGKIVGEKDLADLGAEVHIATEDGSAGHKGMVSELLEQILPQVEDSVRIFACGPVAMLKVVARIAARCDIPAYVSLEEQMACGVGACLGCACQVTAPEGETRYKMVCSDGPVFDAQEISWK
jgi:dihydroorotate dehydrogenase electron transfer subunit